MNDWKKYQNGLILDRVPDCNNSDICKYKVVNMLVLGGGVFARWTSDFDCGYETGWWYCIRDTPIDKERMTSKQRYRINHGLKNATIRLISKESVDISIAKQIFDVTNKCYEKYPLKYRPQIIENKFIEDIVNKRRLSSDIWVCIDNESNELCGYAFCKIKSDTINLDVVKVHPEFLNKDINAALTYSICSYYLGDCNFRYVCDGARNIKHESNYQDFLVRVLGFRYAYCHLHIVYHPVILPIIYLLYPFRQVIRKLSSHNNLIYNISCILKQEEIARTFR